MESRMRRRATKCRRRELITRAEGLHAPDDELHHALDDTCTDAAILSEALRLLAWRRDDRQITTHALTACRLACTLHRIAELVDGLVIP